MPGAAKAQLKYPWQGVDGCLLLSNQTTQACVCLPSSAVHSSVAAGVGNTLLGIMLIFNIKKTVSVGVK